MANEMEFTPLSKDERALMSHVTMFGSAGYPVQKLGRCWIVADSFGVKGPPTVYKTKRAAVAQFELWLDLMRQRLAEEAYARATGMLP